MQITRQLEWHADILDFCCEKVLLNSVEAALLEFFFILGRIFFGHEMLQHGFCQSLFQCFAMGSYCYMIY